MTEAVVVEKRWGVYGNIHLVGQDGKGKPNCGDFRSFYGCLGEGGSHNIIAKDGRNHKGEVYVERVPFTCGKYSCGICYRSWASREARRAEFRLLEAQKQFGDCEHLSCTFPPSDYHLSYDVLHSKAVKGLKARLVIGGCLIWHPFRYKRGVGWYYSPHFHVLGFVYGSYDRCRYCKDKKCVGRNKEYMLCNGFNARSRRFRAEHDGLIVKVAVNRETKTEDKRWDIFWTLRYILGHSGFDASKKHFRIVSWFGCCSCNKLKISVKMVDEWNKIVRKRVCPICEEELVKIRYDGNRFVINEHILNKERSFFDAAVDELGCANWVRVEGGRYE